LRAVDLSYSRRESVQRSAKNWCAATLRDGYRSAQGYGVVTSCFNDWKHFLAVLREIASGEDGRPLTSFETQKRAREVLTDCG
jgi:hypothetical protein